MAIKNAKNEKGLPVRQWGDDAGALAGLPRAAFDQPTAGPDMASLGKGIKEATEFAGFYNDPAQYLDKKGTPMGEAAKLNCLPPGTDITNQYGSDIREMPLKLCTDVGYEGDGWD